MQCHRIKHYLFFITISYYCTRIIRELAVRTTYSTKNGTKNHGIEILCTNTDLKLCAPIRTYRLETLCTNTWHHRLSRQETSIEL